MGATAAVVFVWDGEVRIAHVGDCRVYHHHAGKLTQVTTDQTLVARMVELGTLTPEEAKSHPSRNEVTHAVGKYPTLEPARHQLRLEPGDRFVEFHGQHQLHTPRLALDVYYNGVLWEQVVVRRPGAFVGTLELPEVTVRDEPATLLLRTDVVSRLAREFRAAGFRALHVVDLDAATGRGSNAAVVRELLAEPGLELQVGGGVRDAAAVAALAAAGAARVVVGTRAVEDPAWVAAVAQAFPSRLVVAADVRGRRVTTHGWSRNAGPDIADFVARLGSLPLLIQHRERLLQA